MDAAGSPQFARLDAIAADANGIHRGVIAENLVQRGVREPKEPAADRQGGWLSPGRVLMVDGGLPGRRVDGEDQPVRRVQRQNHPVGVDGNVDQRRRRRGNRCEVGDRGVILPRACNATIDVFIPGRPNMGEVALVDRVPLPCELCHGFRHVDGVPYDDGIGHQIEATGLID